MTLHLRWLAVGGIALAVSAAALVLVSTRTETVTEVGVAGRANANASIATNGSFVSVAWAARTEDGVTDIYATTSRDGGRSFGAPVRVNQHAGDASASGEQPPRIALIARPTGDPSVAVTWTAKASAGTRLMSAGSTNGGRSFGPAQSVPGSDAGGNRGWESVAVTGRGDVVAVWLDHREAAARPAGGAAMSAPHQHGATGQARSVDGVARAQLSQIFFAQLNDPASARAIAPGVCYCCKTSVATGFDGSIVVAWRHVYRGNVRDIALTRSSDGGRTFAPPVRVSEDNWVLDGCPENGPAVAMGEANSIHVVWPTLVPTSRPGGEPTMALFYASSSDGHRFTPRQRIPTEGFPGHPQIAIGSNGELVVAWDEQAEGRRRVAVARGSFDANHTPRFIRQVIEDREYAVYPVVSSLQQGAIVAWTGGSTGETMLRVKRLPTGVQ